MRKGRSYFVFKIYADGEFTIKENINILAISSVLTRNIVAVSCILFMSTWPCLSNVACFSHTTETLDSTDVLHLTLSSTLYSKDSLSVIVALLL